MPRYIDAEKIEIRVPYGYNNDGEVLIPLAAVNQSIARTPTEDVVEVVRCKDCCYWDCDGYLGRCETTTNGITRDYTEPTDFCSYGSRKEQA